jgi:hypothetical protein
MWRLEWEGEKANQAFVLRAGYITLCRVVFLFGMRGLAWKSSLSSFEATETIRVCIGIKFALVWDFILSLDLCPFGIPDHLASVLGHIDDALWVMGNRGWGGCLLPVI